MAPLIVASLLVTPVWAQEAPPQALQRVQDDLKAGRARARDLDRESDQGRKDLARLRLQLVRLAEQEREQDAELAALEHITAPLEAEERAMAERLDSDRAQTGRFLAALQRLSRLPPETALARPESPLNTLRSALMLRDMVPVLRQRAEALAQSLQHLADARERLNHQRARILAARLTLAERRRALDALVSRREELSRQTEEERRAVAQRMARLGDHAGDLRQLMERVEIDRRAAAPAAARREAERAEADRRLAEEQAEEQRGQDRKTAEPAPPPPERLLPEQTVVAALPPAAAPATLRGGLTLPVGGTVATRYGEADHSGANSRGITIATRAGATVTAPFSGSIMFAGPFRGYGQILIVEHGNGYHSLIAGLGRIDTAVGKHVATGEPIGLMPSPSDGNAELYFELRRHGQPINPQSGFAGPEGKGQG